MVRILTGAAAGAVASLKMPTPQELKQLDKIVSAKFPKFACADNEPEPDRQRSFRYAFWGVGQLGRRREVETRDAHASTWWCDYISNMLQDAGVLDQYEIGQGMLALAVLAHGDVPHTISADWPRNVSFGLSIGTGDYPATDAWRKVLDSNQLVRATDLPKLYEPAAVQQVRIQGASW